MKKQLVAIGITCSILFSQQSHADINAGLEALEHGKFEQAQTLLEEHAHDVRAQVGLAKLFLDTDLDEAEEWIEKALQQQPENAEVQYILGVVRGYQAQDSIFSALSYAKKSKTAFEKAVKLAPEKLEYMQGLFSFNINAPSIAGGDLDEAKALVEKIAGIDPVQGVVANMRLAIAKEDPEAVNTILSSGMEKYPNNIELAYDAGMFFQEEEQWEKAFTYLEIAAYTDNDEDLVTRYLALYQLGRTAVFSELRTDDGVQALSDYIENAPEHSDLSEKVWAELRLAMLLEQQGKTNEAKSIFKRLSKSDNKRLRKEAKKQLRG